MLFLCLTSTNGYSERTDAGELDKLLAGIAAQSTAALAELYEKTSACVYSFALSILKNTHDAEDVLQDCFLNVYAAAADYQTAGKPLAWMMTITKNLCLKKLREQKKTDGNASENLETAFSADSAVTSEDKMVLLACMQCLSDEERQIVVLHAVSGFRHREIAQLLSLHLSTVLSKYNRALKKLKNHMMKGAQDE